MSKINITLPAMGEGITDATITKVLVNNGDSINDETVVVEVATDKVDSEVTSSYSGKVVSINVNEGDVVSIGSVLVVIESDEIADEAIDKSTEPISKSEFSTFATNTKVPEENKDQNRVFLSPLVKQLISEHSLSKEEVNQISGSGLNNRITKDDVLDFIKKQKQTGEIIIERQQVNNIEEKEIKLQQSTKKISEITIPSAEVEIVEMDRMRKLIADHMVQSVHTSAHVTSFIEVDVTKLVEWRTHIKDEYFKKHGEKITFMPVFIESAAMVINDYPQVNVSVEGNNIIYKKNINIGIATALPSGNLIVPVIKNADQKNLIGLTKSLNDLANRARDNKLLPDEIKGGTFTITNLGSFGTLTGTPIINQPECAILAVGAIRKIPAVIETPAGDAIAIRQKVILSLTYDHRIIDGALAGAFLKKVCDTVQNFDISRKF